MPGVPGRSDGPSRGLLPPNRLPLARALRSQRGGTECLLDSRRVLVGSRSTQSQDGPAVETSHAKSQGGRGARSPPLVYVTVHVQEEVHDLSGVVKGVLKRAALVLDRTFLGLHGVLKYIDASKTPAICTAELCSSPSYNKRAQGVCVEESAACEHAGLGEWPGLCKIDEDCPTGEVVAGRGCEGHDYLMNHLSSE